MTFIEKELIKWKEKFPKGTKVRLCGGWFVRGREATVKDVTLEFTEYNQHIVRVSIGLFMEAPPHMLKLLSECDECPHRMYPLLGRKCPNEKKES